MYGCFKLNKAQNSKPLKLMRKWFFCPLYQKEQLKFHLIKLLPQKVKDMVRVGVAMAFIWPGCSCDKMSETKRAHKEIFAPPLGLEL